MESIPRKYSIGSSVNAARGAEARPGEAKAADGGEPSDTFESLLKMIDMLQHCSAGHFWGGTSDEEGEAQRISPPMF